MSELMVYKANELAVSRYDLTEHETKLILCGVSLLDPTIENPNLEQRTIKLSYQEYAKIMGLTPDNAYHRLNKATSELMTRTVEIIYPEGDTEKTIFQWVNYAKFSRKDQCLELVFSEYIIPYLFHLKRFIKYNLEHVKAFENKYSMRIYEWLLKELTQRKTNKANIQIGLDEFKFMLMLENKYPEFKILNHWVLSKVLYDINTYSNMRLVIDKKGRPVNTLIFQVELDNQMDLVTEISKQDNNSTFKTPQNAPEDVKSKRCREMYSKLENTLIMASMSKITLSEFEYKLLSDMKAKYELNRTFDWLSEKQHNKLLQILNRYL
jgi:plasmid replication initiation protein